MSNISELVRFAHPALEEIKEDKDLVVSEDEPTEPGDDAEEEENDDKEEDGEEEVAAPGADFVVGDWNGRKKKP